MYFNVQCKTVTMNLICLKIQFVYLFLGNNKSCLLGYGGKSSYSNIEFRIDINSCIVLLGEKKPDGETKLEITSSCYCFIIMFPVVNNFYDNFFFFNPK